MNDTTRMYPRSMRDAFREYGENAIGIAGPIVVPTRPPLAIRVLRWLLQR